MQIFGQETIPHSSITKSWQNQRAQKKISRRTRSSSPVSAIAKNWGQEKKSNFHITSIKRGDLMRSVCSLFFSPARFWQAWQVSISSKAQSTTHSSKLQRSLIVRTPSSRIFQNEEEGDFICKFWSGSLILITFHRLRPIRPCRGLLKKVSCASSRPWQESLIKVPCNGRLSSVMMIMCLGGNFVISTLSANGWRSEEIFKILPGLLNSLIRCNFHASFSSRQT